MKIYSKLIVAIGLCCMISCSQEEDHIFDKSSAERTAEAMIENKAYLTSVPNGWVMEYFPNTATAGAVFLVRFDANGSCEIATKNEYQKSYAKEISLYELISDNGPVLTFNSYNSLLHLYSYPSLPNGTSADGKGLEGDYEFIVMSKEEGQLWLKGKKHGAYIRLTPIEDGVEWEAYFEDLDLMKNRLFSTENRFPLYHYQGDTVTLAYDGRTQIFNMVKPGEDYEVGEASLFIQLKDGIRFYSGNMSVEGKKYVPNAENTRIYSVDNPDTDYFTGPPMAPFMEEKITYTWKIDTTAMSAQGKEALQKIRQKLSLRSIYNGQMKLSSVELGSATFQGQLQRALVYRFQYNKTTYVLPVKITLKASGNNTINLDIPEPYDYSSSTLGAAFVKAGFDEFLLLLPILKGQYTLSSKNGFILKDMVMTGPDVLSISR